MPGQSVGVHGPARLGPSFKWAGTAQHVDPLSPRKIGPSRPGTACWTGLCRVEGLVEVSNWALGAVALVVEGLVMSKRFMSWVILQFLERGERL